MAPSSRPHDSGVSDAVLAERAVTGDHDAFQIIVQRYNQTLYRAARSILRDDNEAEEAVQEAYLLGYRAIGKFRGDAKLSTWLVRIVVNEAIGRKRKRDRRAEIISSDGELEAAIQAAVMDVNAASAEQPEHETLRAEMRRLLEAKIDALPDAFRTVFVLRTLEEMTVEETAASLGIPQATVRTRYFRARGLLREALARDVDFVFEDAFSFAGKRCDRMVRIVMERIKQLRVHQRGA